MDLLHWRRFGALLFLHCEGNRHEFRIRIIISYVRIPIVKSEDLNFTGESIAMRTTKYFFGDFFSLLSKSNSFGWRLISNMVVEHK